MHIFNLWRDLLNQSLNLLHFCQHPLSFSVDLLIQKRRRGSLPPGALFLKMIASSITSESAVAAPGSKTYGNWKTEQNVRFWIFYLVQQKSLKARVVGSVHISISIPLLMHFSMPSRKIRPNLAKVNKHISRFNFFLHIRPVNLSRTKTGVNKRT